MIRRCWFKAKESGIIKQQKGAVLQRYPFCVHLSEIENLRTSKEQFAFAVRKFMQMETLTPALLNELIEKIEVHSIEGKGKNRTQKIIIHYRFIGVIENPVKEENIVLEARQGVAVEYLTA